MNIKDHSLPKDEIDTSRICRYLGSCGKGYKIEYHKTIVSTNTYAKELAKKGAPNGFVVLAGSQSGGRGRMGRSFYSPEGTGIYMSLVLRPEMKLADTVKITTFAAVCICDVIDSLYGTESQIKWVNDIMIGGKKVCGILTEAEFDSVRSVFDHIVLGIGINIKKVDFPADIIGIAGSIEEFSDKKCSQNELVALILKNLSPLLDGDIPKGSMDAYRARSLFLGKEVFTLSEPSLSGVAEEIDDSGALIIRSSDGSLHKIAAGEVSVRKLD